MTSSRLTLLPDDIDGRASVLSVAEVGLPGSGWTVPLILACSLDAMSPPALPPPPQDMTRTGTAISTTEKTIITFDLINVS